MRTCPRSHLVVFLLTALWFSAWSGCESSEKVHFWPISLVTIKGTNIHGRIILRDSSDACKVRWIDTNGQLHEEIYYYSELEPWVEGAESTE